MLGQVLLAEEAVQAQQPGVFHRLRIDPHVRGASDVILAVDEHGVPLHQPLEVDVVGDRQGSLGKARWRGRVKGQAVALR